MFKNPKLIKIAKLYNKIINDFKVDKVYITDIFHPRNDKELLTMPVLIEVETYDTNDDEIFFIGRNMEKIVVSIPTLLKIVGIAR